MRCCTKQNAVILVLVGALVGMRGGASAAQQMTDCFDTNTIGFLHVDLQAFDLEKAFQFVDSQQHVIATTVPNGKRILSLFKASRAPYLREFLRLKQAGAEDAYAIFSLVDLPVQPPAVLITAKSAEQAEMLKTDCGFPCMVFGPNLVIGSPAVLDRVQNHRLKPRGDLDSLLKQVEGNLMTLVIAPSADQRRAIREVLPAMPAPWQNFDGPLLADGLKRIVVSVESWDRSIVKLLVESENEPSRVKLMTEVSAVTRLIGSGEIALPPIAKNVWAALIGSLDSKTQANWIEFKFTADHLEAIAKSLRPGIQQFAKQQSRGEMRNKVRQLALSFHNGADAENKLPGYANFDTNGKPLLSWRVHMLPWLDQNSLYKQFHLDESWDSPHNKKLISSMPAIYAVPAGWLENERNDELMKSGKTVFVVPRGKGVFGQADGMLFRDIKDGTSNTIMIMTAPADKAVVWTKPDDLEVDLANPIDSLFTNEMLESVVVFADASVRVINNDITNEKLKALFTVDGGELVFD